MNTAIAILLVNIPGEIFLTHELKSLYLGFPAGIAGLVLLLFRAGTGVLFMLHGYPKLTHLRTWANALKLPVFLCFLSAFSMIAGGVCLVLGLLTPLASIAILGSMLFAMVLEISQGLPFVARDPYLIPEGQYEGPKGKGEPPSWEKAFMYCLMLMTIAVLGPGLFSLDAALFAP
ncbi:DoxX family protein [Pantanalinema sp. GBBB05]|uniref:DoxX family protein n=1 Tax=Pantanalinema sp. GBBB05 TaxID=2604139 RepID=UPI001DE3AD60|nr:DoxX family protein [Pantanalinema sp. GBBB05]